MNVQQLLDFLRHQNLTLSVRETALVFSDDKNEFYYWTIDSATTTVFAGEFIGPHTCLDIIGLEDKTLSGVLSAIKDDRTDKGE